MRHICGRNGANILLCSSWRHKELKKILKTSQGPIRFLQIKVTLNPSLIHSYQDHMATRTVAALAAQMAAGDGDSRIEFELDAGNLHSRDLSAALPRDTSVLMSSTLNASQKNSAASKLRQTVSNAQSRKDTMVTLKAAVLDALSLLQSMNDDGNNRMKALHKRLRSSNEDCVAELVSFDGGFEWLDEVGFDIPRLIREAKCELDVSFLTSFGMPVRIPDEHLIAEKFEVLSTVLLEGSKAEQMLLELRRDITKVLFPFGDGNVPEIMIALNTFTMTDIVGRTNSALNATRDELEQLDRCIREGEEEIARLLQAEQMQEAEKVENDLVNWCEKRLELTIKRVGILNSSDGAKGEGLLAQLDSIIKNPVVANLNEEKLKLKDVITSDIRKVEDDRIEKLRENDSAIARYNINVERSKKKIRENHEAQHQKWVELENILMDIIALGNEGERLTRAHVLMTEVEQKRRQEHREFRDSFAKHRQTLDDLLQNTESAISFTDDLKQAMLDGKEKLIENKVEETLRNLLKRERKTYLRAFEEYGTKCQNSIGRAEKRSAALERMANDIGFARKQASQTGDDGGTVYAKRLHDMEKQIRKFRKTAEKFEADFEKYETVYVRVETSLLEALGDEATIAAADEGGLSHEPVTLHLEIKQRKAEQFKKFVERSTAITTANISSAAEVKSRQGQLAAEVSVLKDQVDARKLALKSIQNRSFGSDAGGDASRQGDADCTGVNASSIDISAVDATLNTSI